MLRNFEKELKRIYDKGLISQELLEELTSMFVLVVVHFNDTE